MTEGEEMIYNVFMDLDSIIKPLQSINPAKVILFGSYAYGTPRKDSDIDLLIIVDTDKNFHQRVQQIRPLLPASKAIDLIVLTPAEYKKAKGSNPLVAEIESRGKVIYG